jgi:hypothetical protein
MEQTVVLPDNEYDNMQTKRNFEESSSNEEDYVTRLEALPGYMERHKAYQDFLKDNELLHESTRYFTSREEEQQFHAQSIPLSELLRERIDLEEEEVEIIGMEELMQSYAIEEVITRTEQDKGEKELKEYHSYYETIKGLLQYIPSLYFATIWSEAKELVEVNNVSVNALNIDDLAYLNYDEMICIRT